MPHLNPCMNRISSDRLNTTTTAEEAAASLGSLSVRTVLARMWYSTKTGAEPNTTVRYCRAKGRSASSAPKRSSIRSRRGSTTARHSAPTSTPVSSTSWKMRLASSTWSEPRARPIFTLAPTPRVMPSSA